MLLYLQNKGTLWANYFRQAYRSIEGGGRDLHLSRCSCTSRTKALFGRTTSGRLTGASRVEVVTSISPDAPVPPEQRHSMGELLPTPGRLTEASRVEVITPISPDARVPPEQRQSMG